MRLVGWHIYTHTYTHTHTAHTHARTHTHKHTHTTYTRTHTYTQAHMHTHAHTLHIHTHATHTQAHTCTHTHNTRHTHTHTHTCIHTFLTCVSTDSEVKLRRWSLSSVLGHSKAYIHTNQRYCDETSLHVVVSGWATSQCIFSTFLEEAKTTTYMLKCQIQCSG